MQSIASKKQSLKDKVKAQIEYLGYINIVDERYKGILAVLEINTTYSPKLKVYSLKNGTVLDMKIDKRTYNSCKLETGDIIKISGFTKKPKVKRNEDGKFEPIAGTSEMWITKYTKLEDI
jgi:DNA polymerase-3 subunit alpha